MKDMKTNYWLSYNDLAWTERIIAPVQETDEETEEYCRIIRESAGITAKTLLHLACGAGYHDFTFKKHFSVTGIDISRGMLAEARKLNPEVTYHHGDMRTVALEESFDAAVIPDAIGYMTTEEDLRKALTAATRHVKPGGVLLVGAQTKEEFRNNNFAYSGKLDAIEITVFENNYIAHPDSSTYEAVMVYLIRRNGELEIITDRHVIGVFSRKVWRQLFDELNLQVTEKRMDHLYDQYLLEDGAYPMTFFVCRKE
jgi:ubiquinone/menaquinone biosynthesis C-methylase UbiE